MHLVYETDKKTQKKMKLFVNPFSISYFKMKVRLRSYFNHFCNHIF